MEFEELLRPIYPELIRYARAMAGSSDAGDDLLQDSLLKAWSSFAQLKNRDRFKYWLIRILRNTYRSQMRLKWMRNWLSLEAVMDQPAETGLPFEDKELVRQALQAVPVVQREALILFEIAGMKIEEIATIQKTSVSAVKSRLSRGRLKLRKRYEALDRTETGHEADLAKAG